MQHDKCKNTEPNKLLKSTKKEKLESTTEQADPFAWCSGSGLKWERPAANKKTALVHAHDEVMEGTLNHMCCFLITTSIIVCGADPKP